MAGMDLWRSMDEESSEVIGPAVDAPKGDAPHADPHRLGAELSDEHPRSASHEIDDYRSPGSPRHAAADLSDDKRVDAGLSDDKRVDAGLSDKRHRVDDDLSDKRHRVDDDLSDKRHRVDDDLSDKRHRDDDLSDKRHRVDDDLSDKRHRVDDDLSDKRHRVDDDLSDKRHRVDDELSDKRHRVDDDLSHKRLRVDADLSHKRVDADIRGSSSVEVIDIDKGIICSALAGGATVPEKDLLRDALPETETETETETEEDPSKLFAALLAKKKPKDANSFYDLRDSIPTTKFIGIDCDIPPIPLPLRPRRYEDYVNQIYDELVSKMAPITPEERRILDLGLDLPEPDIVFAPPDSDSDTEEQ